VPQARRPSTLPNIVKALRNTRPATAATPSMRAIAASLSDKEWPTSRPITRLMRWKSAASKEAERNEQDYPGGLLPAAYVNSPASPATPQ